VCEVGYNSHCPGAFRPIGYEHSTMASHPYLLLFAALYFVALLAVGVLAGRTKRNSNQYLNATAALPLWVSIAACVAANCGSLEVVAMMALGAQYGMMACHFYWIGAIPPLLAVAFWLLPAYAKRGYQSVPDLIEDCYGRPTRSLAAFCMAAMMMLLAGVCLCAVAQVLTAYLGWSFLAGVLLCAPLVLVYTWMGGFRATVYTELLHFSVVLATVVPLFLLMLHSFGGLPRWLAALPPDRLHTWKTLPLLDPHAPLDRFGIFVGLSLVLSFAFWSTDFIQMQRALAVRRRDRVALVPLSVATSKIFFAFVIVLPGVTAPLVLNYGGRIGWSQTLPALLIHYFAPAWVGLGSMGLAASLLSTFANNVEGFTSVWVQSIYQAWLNPHKSDAHYLRVGQFSNAAAVVGSIGAAYLTLTFQSLMEYIQMVLAIFNAPLFALVILAAFLPARVYRGGLKGLGAGLGAAVVHQILLNTGVLHYGSRLAADFYGAIYCFALTLLAVLIFHRLETAQPRAASRVRVPKGVQLQLTPLTAAWGTLLAAAFAFLTVTFW